MNHKTHGFRNLFASRFQDLRNHPEYQAELLKIETAEAIYGLMEKNNISRAELARRIGCKPPYITKLLRGSANITLETLAKVAFVFNARLDLRFRPSIHDGEVRNLVDHSTGSRRPLKAAV